MLKNRKAISEHAAWSDVLPWIGLITPNLILCKDGSLLACYEIDGIDIDNQTIDLINSAVRQIERAFKALDNSFTIWFSVSKLRDKSYIKPTFENSAAADLDGIIAKSFLEGSCFSIKHRLYITYTGATGVNKFMDTVNTLTRDQDISFPIAVLMALNPATASKNAALFDKRQLEINVSKFELKLKEFSNIFHTIRLSRMSEWALETALIHEANICLDTNIQFKKPPMTMLDSWGSLSSPTFSREMVQVKGRTRSENKYVNVLSVSEYAPENHSIMLETLLTIECELKLCHVIRFLDVESARKEIDEGIGYFYVTQFSLFSRLVSKMTGKPPEADAGKHDLWAQCMEAKRRQNADGLGFALHSFSISVLGDTPKECEDNTSFVARIFSDVNFSVIRERINLTAAFAAMLPGQWATQVRLKLQNHEVLADCMPIFTCNPGSQHHGYFSELAKKSVPKFSVFRSFYGGKTYFDSHVSQVGHMVIIAPTGGGKTTIVNFVSSQFKRYPESNVIIMDRDYSCRITTGLMHGTHVDMRLKNMRVNPMTALQDGSSDGPLWLREFVIRRLAEGNYTTTAADRKAIDDAISTISNPNLTLRLSVLASQLPSHLRLQLSEWLEGRPYGMFDNDQDDFKLESWTCIEMKEIMANERIARAYLDYAFRKIIQALDGRPTFIYLEEASFLLNHPAFADMIDDWLKTLRKKNAFLWMTIQSPSAVTNSEMSATLLDNIKSVLLLYNPKVDAHRDAYKTKFGLTDDQVSRIKHLRPAKDYMLIKDGRARVLETNFPKEAMPYLRSELHLQKKFTELQNSGAANWRQQYLQVAYEE